MYVTAVSHSIVTVLYAGLLFTRQHCLSTPAKRGKAAAARDTSFDIQQKLDYGLIIWARTLNPTISTSSPADSTSCTVLRNRSVLNDRSPFARRRFGSLFVRITICRTSLCSIRPSGKSISSRPTLTRRSFFTFLSLLSITSYLIWSWREDISSTVLTSKHWYSR